jgi:hypothetical protein
VIESLRPSERHTGRNLYDGVLVPRQEKSSLLKVDYWEAPDKESFFDALHAVLYRAQSGRLPILHIEAHGTRAGVHLTDKTVVRWEEFRSVLTAINEATRFRLLVVMALCKGAYLATTLNPPKPAPAWAVLGPEVDVEDLDIEAGMWMQYEALLGGEGGDAALVALNAEQSSPSKRYHLRSAELLFHSAVWEFFQRNPPEILKEHENMLVAETVRRWDADILGAMRAREVAKARLRDEQYWYDFWRPHFLMLDRFPENASRFTLTFPDYVAARSRGLL